MFSKLKIFRQFILATCLGLVLLGLGLAGVIQAPPTAQAHAGYERSIPASNARLPAGKPPVLVQVWFTEPLEVKFSKLTVFDKDGARVDLGNSQVSQSEPKSMFVGLKSDLPDGFYTVVFENASTEDGHTIKGSLAFVVGTGALPATQSTSPLDLAEQNVSTENRNSNFWTISLRLLNYLAGTAFVGALGFVLLVWPKAVIRAKASKRMGPELTAASQRGVEKVQPLAWLSLAGLFIGWFGWFIYQAGAFSNQNPGQLLGFGVTSGGSGPQALTDFLFGSRYGSIWLARLVLLALAAGAWWLAVRVRKNARPAGEETEEEANTRGALAFGRIPLWWVAAGFGAAVLLTTSLNSHAAGVEKITVLAVGSDWLHLLSVAVWVGGLAGMALALAGALPALRPGTGDRTRLLSALLPAFSQLAIRSVVVLLLTGVFQSVLQLTSVNELFTSVYGLSLLAKVILLVPLLLLGAYNLLVTTPRLRGFARSKAAGPKEGPGSIAAGALGLTFRKSILAEIILGLVILVAAAVLTSQSPPKNVAATSSVQLFKFEQNGLMIDLAISPGLLGDNTFETRLTDTRSGQPVSDAALVNLRTSMVGMDMGDVQLELKATGANNGRYLAQGPILSMAGVWHATLLVQRNGREDVNMPVTIQVK
ncbi:MAG: CopD family protein [Chloroflexi bacterium]|nr:CopD family protein [Chloroflexota bacterium]